MSFCKKLVPASADAVQELGQPWYEEHLSRIAVSADEEA
jgi:hypothetical protein